MKKKTIANLIMVAVILVVMAAGVLGVGHIQGWFDAKDGAQGVLTGISGIINLERDGVAYPVTEDTVLRAGDKLSCESGAVAVIRLGEDTVTIGEQAAFVVTDPAADAFAVEVTFGQFFADCAGSASFTFEGHTADVTAAVALLSVRTGAQTVTVLSGTVDGVSAGNCIEYVGESRYTAPLSVSALNEFALTQIRKTNERVPLCVTNAELDRLEAERQAALQEMLNDADKLQSTDEEDHVHSYLDSVVEATCSEGGYTSHICACGDSYTDGETQPKGHTWDDWVTTIQPTVEQEGSKQRGCVNCDVTETRSLAKLEAEHTHTYTEKTVAASCTGDGYTLYTCGCGVSYKDQFVTATGHQYQDTVVAPTCTSGGYTIHTCACGATYRDGETASSAHHWGDWVVTKEATTTESGSKERSCTDCGTRQSATIEQITGPVVAGYVYITIRCDAILSNRDDLDPAKAEFVPANGVILPAVSVGFYEGETVFDVLKRACETAGIQLEYSWTPMYDSYYVEGINNLYEFDCGEQSGWMYTVNGWSPNYGCSSYGVEDGDTIVWDYTCNGQSW